MSSTPQIAHSQTLPCRSNFPNTGFLQGGGGPEELVTKQIQGTGDENPCNYCSLHKSQRLRLLRGANKRAGVVAVKSALGFSENAACARCRKKNTHYHHITCSKVLHGMRKLPPSPTNLLQNPRALFPGSTRPGLQEPEAHVP